jgi:hypothetical protein
MKKKLELNQLTVKSFIADYDQSKIYGGAEETEPAGCGQQTYTCPTFGYGDCTDNIRLCIG